jgi:hypothetical protein
MNNSSSGSYSGVISAAESAGNMSQGRQTRTSRVDSERQRDGQAGASFGPVGSLNGPAMHAHYSFDERQTQTVAGRISPFDAALKDLRADLRLESRSVVFHNQHSGIFVCPKGNCYGA